MDIVPHGVRVNAVSPGSILVAGNGWDRYRIASQSNFDDYVRHGFPMGRLGTAEEVADVIAFTASPRACWSNLMRRLTGDHSDTGEAGQAPSGTYRVPHFEARTLPRHPSGRGLLQTL